MEIVGGRRIIDRIASCLREVCGRLLVISDDPEAKHWLPDATVAGDIVAQRASLVGIHSALTHAAGDVIVVAWDMPFVPVPLLAALRDRLRSGTSAVVPFTTKGPEAVCAAYSADALPHIEHLVRIGALKLSDLLDALPKVDRMTATDLARFGSAEIIFFNVNSPADLTRAGEIADAL